MKGYYVKGYCEIEQGRVEFKGRMNGVSHAQVRFYLIYALRKKFNIECWINPIFEKCTYLSSEYILETNRLHCLLKNYNDGIKRNFIRFSKYEAKRLDNVRDEEVSDVKLELNNLPEFKEADKLEPFLEQTREKQCTKFEDVGINNLDEKVVELCTFYNEFGEDFRDLEKEYEFFHSSNICYEKNESKELYGIIEKNKNHKIIRVEKHVGAFGPGAVFYYFDFLIYYDINGNLVKPTYIKQRKEEGATLVKAIGVVPDNYLISVSGLYNDGEDIMIYVVKYKNMYKEFVISDVSIKMKDYQYEFTLNNYVVLKLLEEFKEYKTYIGIKILKDVCELAGIENIRYEIDITEDNYKFSNYEDDISGMIYCSGDGRYHDAEDAWMYDGSCD